MRPALQAEQPVPSNKTLVMLLLGIVLVGANMRAAIASVGPLIGFIRDDTGLSNGAVGWLTTIPLIGFAVLSPFAPSLARRYGTERTLVATLALMTIGIGLRAFDSVPLLFVGTAGVGIGIAVCNVLLPSIVKQNFINRVGFMTGLYSMTMSIFASIAAGISVPLSQGAGWGWRNTLLVWAALSLLGLLIWLPMARSSQARGGGGAKRTGSGKSANVWKSGLAWQVTFYMGFQSFNYYVSVAWLPEILLSHGWSPVNAGWMLSVMQLTGIPFNFLVPAMAERLKDQRLVAAAGALIGMAGYAGLLIDNAAIATVAVILMGIGQSICISLALTFIALRARNATQAAALSGMSQSMGYALAALGPICLGALHDVTAAWTWPVIALLGTSSIMVAAGLGAGRNRYID